MSLRWESELLTRRSWLQLGAGALAMTLAGTVGAAEGTGKWTDKSIAEYTVKLLEWLKTDFARRAESLSAATGVPFKLEYDYLAPTTDKNRLRDLERYAAGRLSGRASEQHVTRCLAECEKIRKSLAEAEAKAAAAWKPVDEQDPETIGRIYDSEVKSGRLTVVLDNSRSMAPFLDAVRAEISRDFSSAYFVEVNGCAMEQSAACPWFYCGKTSRANPFTPDRHIPKLPVIADFPHSQFIRWTRDAPAALECMVDLMRTDAIYWFCDFDDPVRDDVASAFVRKAAARKVKLYIHTLARKPPTVLAEYAESSGGKVVRKRI